MGKQRLAVVTGASRGIGKAIAQELDARNFSTILVARNKHKLEELAATLRSATVIACDLSSETEVRNLANRISEIGSVDVLVNNAATLTRESFDNMEIATWRVMFQVNVFAPTHLSQLLLPGLRATRGRIINIASISGKLGTPMLAAYCASKHALIGVTRSLAAELSGEVLVNAICPGSVDTEMLQQGLPGAVPDLKPTEVANFVGYLAEDAPRSINGSALDIFG